ncbi:hypothetical protein, partial [Desulfovibrio sp.]|uniref:hypothetical protein n=1 Tax=Desulfovibrio sp. TaxID=885 RepID=UPI003AB349A0
NKTSFPLALPDLDVPKMNLKVRLLNTKRPAGAGLENQEAESRSSSLPSFNPGEQKDKERGGGGNRARPFPPQAQRDTGRSQSIERLTCTIYPQ